MALLLLPTGVKREEVSMETGWWDRGLLRSVQSVDGQHRYFQSAHFTAKINEEAEAVARTLMWIILHPGAQPLLEPDNVLTPCYDKASALGYQRCIVTHLFSVITNSAKDLPKMAHPIGRRNEHFITHHAYKTLYNGGRVAFGWGAGGDLMDRGRIMTRMLQDRFDTSFYCLGETPNHQPAQPRFQPPDRLLKEYWLEIDED